MKYEKWNKIKLMKKIDIIVPYKDNWQMEIVKNMWNSEIELNIQVE